MASELNLKDTTSPEVVSFHLRDSANLSGDTQDQESYENTNTDTSGRRIKSQESPKGEKWASERRRSLSDGDSMERCAYNEKEEESLRPTNDTKTLIWEGRSKNLKGNHWRFGHDKGNKRYGWDTRRSNDSRDWVTISSRGKQDKLSGPCVPTVWGKHSDRHFLGGSSRGENSFEQAIGTRKPSGYRSDRRPSQKTVDRRTSSLSDRLRQLASLEMDDTVKERVQQLLTFDLDTLLKPSPSLNNDSNVTVVPIESYRRRLAAEGATISCGFIIYTLVPDPVDPSKLIIKYMICQRRDTIQYVVVILGKYSTDAELNRYIPLMTSEEQQRILSPEHTFNELWNDVWAGQTNPAVQSDRDTAQKKFKANISTIIRYAKECQLEKRYLAEPESLFLKGKRTEYDKSDEDCAFREYEEETYCNRDTLTILSKSYAITEEYKGTDARTYSTLYFIARTEYPFNLPERTIVRKTIRDSTISPEIGKIEWKTRAEAGTILNPRRTIALIKAEYFIKEHHNMNTLYHE